MLVSLLPEVALACSCGGASLVEVLPEDGATEVALDARPLLVWWVASREVILRDDATGLEVPIRVDSEAQGGPQGAVVQRIVPLAPLEADHRYVLEPGAGVYAYADLLMPRVFTTGSASDRDAPAADRIETMGGGAFGQQGSCPPSLMLWPEIVGGEEGVAHEVQVDRSPAFDDPSTVTRADTAWLPMGWSFCLTTVSWLAPGQEVWVRSRSVDLSGNAGPWSDPFHVPAIPDLAAEPVDSGSSPAEPAAASEGGGCGCDAAGGLPRSLLVLLTLAATATARVGARRARYSG